MLKKAGNIAIILLLLVATGGLPVTRHYCGASEMSFSVYATPKACCSGHCDKCHNVFKFTKVSDGFEVGTSVNTQSLTNLVVLHTAFHIDSFSNFNIPLVSDFQNQRAFSSYVAGHAPASLGNFRC
jgi:hypothetical protein